MLRWQVPNGALQRRLVPAPPATQSPGPACTPGRTDSPGWVGDPARYASWGWRLRPLLTPGLTQGWRPRGRGLGEPVPRGPRTIWKKQRVKRPPLSCQGPPPPPFWTLPSHLLFGVRLSFCRSEWVRPGRRGGVRRSGSARTRRPARRGSGPRPLSSASAGSAPKGAFPHLDWRTPAHPTPRPFNAVPEASGPRSWTALPRGAAHLPLLPLRPNVRCKTVRDAGAFGDPGPRAP